MAMKLQRSPRWICVMGLGLLSACAIHEQQSQQPAAAATSVPEAWSFEKEWARAVASSAPGTAGEAWEQSINPVVERAYDAVFSDCAAQLDSGDPGTAPNQRFVLDIARDGSVRQVWSETDSPLLACVRASLRRTQFAPAPIDGYRQGLLLDLDESDDSLLDLAESDELPPLPRRPRPAPGSISSHEMLRLAITDMGTREGQLYMQSFNATILELINSNLKKCMTIPLLESERSLQGYRLFVEIAADGTTQRVLVEPDPETSTLEQFQSPRANCLHEGLANASLAAPPWDGFWVYVGLDNPPPGYPTSDGG